MGVIQNSLNTMIATVAGSILGAKHIEQQTAQVKTSELAELAGLEEEVPKIKFEEQPAAEETTQTLETAHQRIGEDLDRKLETQGSFTAADARNATMATRALKIAQGELSSKNLQLKLKEQRLNELRNKYEKDLGGKK